MARLLTDADVVQSALHPLRRLLLSMLSEPASASRLAEASGLPRQKVNYHLRALESDGLVTLVEERQRRGLTERLLARADDQVWVDPGLLTDDRVLADERLAGRDRVGLAGVMAAAVSLLRQAATIGSRAAESQSKVAAVTLDATVRLADPMAMRALVEDLARTIARHDRPSDTPDGDRAFRVTCAVLPQLDDPPEHAHEEDDQA